MLSSKKLTAIKPGRTGRVSSWDQSGRNADSWRLEPGESKVLADIKGPGAITHIWMTQADHYRKCLLRITWDNAAAPSVLVPLGDFFGLGHGIVNSYQSFLFTASTSNNNRFNQGCALNSYVCMPFSERAVIELVNESDQVHNQYFYVDYETHSRPEAGAGYFHAEFRRANPFGGWGHEIPVNTPEADIANTERLAWNNNYVILDTSGRGHYIGCNLSVTNFQGTWWGEGDDMIWVDGYKWPPDLHGTGSEDYLNQAWGMQPNAFLRNGTSIHEQDTGGYQTSYVHHLENPIRFEKEIKVTIEHGHGNHLRNEMSSVAYWYAEQPAAALNVPPVEKRLPVKRDNFNEWLHDKNRQITPNEAELTNEMLAMKKRWAQQSPDNAKIPGMSPFVTSWKMSPVFSSDAVESRQKKCPSLESDVKWKTVKAPTGDAFVNIQPQTGNEDGYVYLARRFQVESPGTWNLLLGHDGGIRLFLDGQLVKTTPGLINPARPARTVATLELSAGTHEVTIELATESGRAWGIYFQWENIGDQNEEHVFPKVIDD